MTDHDPHRTRIMVLAFLQLVFRHLRWRVPLNLVMMVSVGLSEGVGILLLVPLLRLVGLDVGSGAVNGLVALISNALARVGLAPNLAIVLGLFTAVMAMNALLVRAQTIQASLLQFNLVQKLRGTLYRAVVHAEWRFLARQRSAAIAHILTHDLEQVGLAVYYLSLALSIGLVSLVYLALAVWSAPLAAAALLVCGGGLFIALRQTTRTAQRLGFATGNSNSDLSVRATEHLGDLKTTKSLGAEERSAERIEAAALGVIRAQTRAAVARANSRAVFEIGGVLMLAVAVFVAFDILQTPIANVFLLLFLFARLMPRTTQVINNLELFFNLLPSFDRFYRLLRECQENAELRTQNSVQPSTFNLQPSTEFPPPFHSSLFTLHSSIALRDVTYRYDPERAAISDLDLDIPARNITVVVGPSGAGKTTVADLVLRLLTPSEGDILVDGRSIQTIGRQAWRSVCGYVPQDGLLLPETVRANLLWSQPDATDAELFEALRAAAADQIVARLPDGLDARLGDRGTGLSGGERQRIVLARALLRRPAILILDEATSALDPETEQQVIETLRQLRGELTILMITHRIGIARIADLVHVLDGGRMVESGTWHSLVAGPSSRLRDLLSVEPLERV